jgi:2'-5' RNA ligase
MPYAIVMHIEETTAPRIAMLWDVLAQRNADGQVKFSDEQVRFNYPPHVTLAVVEETANPDLLVEALKPIVARWTALPISFDSIAVLPRVPVAPMLARPNVTAEFLKLNKEVCDALPLDLISSYHRPKFWQPHVTLARDISPEKLGDALAAVLQRWSGFETTLDQVALVYFRQEGKNCYVRELWRAQLRSRPHRCHNDGGNPADDPDLAEHPSRAAPGG